MAIALPALAPATFPTAVPVIFPISVPATFPTALPVIVPISVPATFPTALPVIVPISVPATFPTAVSVTFPTAVPVTITITIPAPVSRVEPKHFAAPSTLSMCVRRREWRRQVGICVERTLFHSAYVENRELLYVDVYILVSNCIGNKLVNVRQHSGAK